MMETFSFGTMIGGERANAAIPKPTNVGSEAVTCKKSREMPTRRAKPRQTVGGTGRKQLRLNTRDAPHLKICQDPEMAMP